jgi:glutamate-1-semialdehyde 2,1-aminomutase
MAFSDAESIRSAAEIRAESMDEFRKLYSILLNKGIYLGPSGYEVGFISEAHTTEILKQVIERFTMALDELFA